MRRFCSILLTVAAAAAEPIDRLAVVAGRQVVTLSAVAEQLRIAAFLNQEPLADTTANRRRAAERIVDQILLRREMEVSRYAPQNAAEAEAMFAKVRERFPAPESFRHKLDEYRITEEALRRNLLLQVDTLRFLDIRFRPGSTVTDGEIELYYRETFAPMWEKRAGAGPLPEVDDARERIEQILMDGKVDQALEQWLKQARSQVRIRFLEGALQ